jgi:hypothetical protein
MGGDQDTNTGVHANDIAAVAATLNDQTVTIIINNVTTSEKKIDGNSDLLEVTGRVAVPRESRCRMIASGLHAGDHEQCWDWAGRLLRNELNGRSGNVGEGSRGDHVAHLRSGDHVCISILASKTMSDLARAVKETLNDSDVSDRINVRLMFGGRECAPGGLISSLDPKVTGFCELIARLFVPKVHGSRGVQDGANEEGESKTQGSRPCEPPGIAHPLDSFEVGILRNTLVVLGGLRLLLSHSARGHSNALSSRDGDNVSPVAVIVSKLMDITAKRGKEAYVPITEPEGHLSWAIARLMKGDAAALGQGVSAEYISSQRTCPMRPLT